MSGKKILSLAVIFIGVGIISALAAIAFFASRAPTAGLKVDTNIPALVYINNVQIGQTPLDKTFPPGEAIVKIIPISDTFTSPPEYETKVRLADGVYTAIKRDFGSTDSESAGEIVSPLPQTGHGSSLAVVTSSPPTASVTLDGELKGATPLLISSVPAGDHQITISAPGHGSRTISTRTLSGYKLTLNVKLATSPSNLASLSPQVLATTPPLPSPSPSGQPAPAPSTPNVLILDTPTGFLRVRSGPGKAYPEVGQVLPDQSFPLLDSQAGWYHITVELDASASGWVSSQYAREAQ